jgi:CHAT domain-containing protein
MADAAFGGQGRPFPPLAGTAKEAQAIKKHFPNNAIDIVDGPRASERHYRSLVSPEMLFLCTHGFCLRDLGQEKGLRPNPFNQFGLAFAGANTALIGDTPGREDGIVLGKEVLAADLRGTDLVVLSACKTALAENRSSGEGMASLRQAFHLAGARDVVATLWEVPDQQSAELVDLFVEHLRATPPTPPAQALCKAQRDYLVLQRTPGQAGHTHPFFWAAYGLSGPNRR